MKYLLRKVVFYIVALWVAVTLNFLMPRIMPGNPVEIMVAKFRGRINPQAIHAFTQAFGLNNHVSLVQQYGIYLGQLVHGNLGISLAMYPEPVSRVLAQAFPWTLLLMGVSTVISFVVGSLLGVLATWRRGGILDLVAPTVSTFTAAFPYFWLALIFLYILAFRLPLFPLAHAYSGGNASWSPSNWGDILYHAALPGLTIVVSSIGGWLLSMRNNMITTMGQDYITTARAKGLKPRRIMFRYAARNAILPNMTGFAMSLGFVLSGALLTEVVFSYPGLGYTLYQAVQADDYPLMQGTLLLIAVGVLLANFLVDILYVRLDPRAQNQ
ncbi:ABC transporter permease [Sulfobacillus harzensis]|uniref:ABC transporter permease n=1 Tax=Sulfobacillus harzensis TaxID=2729629 RepID=A0A7Y0Q2E9_9FIRM|nr:ABC transporter permease [Sulfobacillus harzensis]NMP22265.1 ABC transporter permease [Sulfobacillus harzensis]